MISALARVQEILNPTGDQFSGKSGTPRRDWYEHGIFNEARLYKALGKEDARTVLSIWRRFAEAVEFLAQTPPPTEPERELFQEVVEALDAVCQTENVGSYDGLIRKALAALTPAGPGPIADIGGAGPLTPAVESGETHNTGYIRGIDPEVRCSFCKRTFLCDPMDTCCRLCGARETLTSTTPPPTKPEGELVEAEQFAEHFLSNFVPTHMGLKRGLTMMLERYAALARARGK